MNFHPFVTHHFVDVEALEALHVAIPGKEFPSMDDIRGLQRKNNEQNKKIDVSIVLRWCHPSVQNMRQSNLTKNGDVNVMFSAKISADAIFLNCLCTVVFASIIFHKQLSVSLSEVFLNAASSGSM